MNAVVKSGEIPYTDVQLEGITAGATSLRSVASAVRDGTADIVTAWSAISGSYEGPSDQELFDVMTPIGPQGTTFGDDLDSAAKALDAFVEEATPIVAALKAYVTRAEQLQRDVAAFQPQTIQTMDGPVTQTESWDQDETLNGENNDIINGVANRVVEYQAAERKCANAIRSLSGLPALHAISGSGDDALGYGYDELPMGTKLPWGTAESRNESCAEKTTWFLPRLVKGVVWDGAIVGTIGGLGELLGFRDWKWSGDNFVDTWKSLGSLIGYDKESNEWFDGDAAKAGWGGLLKGTVAWDKWADDPGTALGESAWNIASLVIPVVGVASKVSTVGRAGEVASAISKAGKVLDLVDAGAWASRGLTKVLPKLGDLKGVLTDGFEHLPDGFRTRIAEFRVDLDEWRHGTHADADGAVDGPAARSEGAADAAADTHAQANANAHAHSEGAESNVPTPEREPALVGGGHGESTTVHGGGSDAGSSGGSGHGTGAPTGGSGGSTGDGGHGTDAGGGGTGDTPPHGRVPAQYSDVTVDSEGVAIDGLIRESRLSPEQLQHYLASQWPHDGSLGREFEATGEWPHDVQIPKGPEVLDSRGGIDWSDVTNDGFAVREGRIDINETVPPIGQVLDRYGPESGSFTSPVLEDGPFPYEERALPYLEDEHQYHRYEVIGDLGDLRGAYDALDPDAQSIAAQLLAERGRSVDDLASMKTLQGEIAGSARFASPGGGIQIKLPLPVETLEVLGLLRELD